MSAPGGTGKSIDTVVLSFTPVLNTTVGGSYSIKVYTDLLNDSNSTNDTSISNITISPIPTASFTAPNLCFGDAFNITDKSTGTVTSSAYSYYLKEISGNKLDSSTQKSGAIFTYFKPGTYRISQQIINAGGCKDTFSMSIKISDSINAHFVYKNVSPTRQVNFKAMDTTLKNYLWDFGDKTSTATGYDTTHSYLTDGRYQVTLTASNNIGCKKTWQDSVIILTTGLPEKSVAGIDIKISPNPSFNLVNIFVNASQSNPLTLDVYDEYGKRIIQLLDKVKVSGKQNIVLDTEKYGLRSGNYILRVSTKDKIVFKKITILK